ncbi:unnamed protein product [Lathyrus sativus]|nr:unnamed protein product [Lathyrus sativus]
MGKGVAIYGNAIGNHDCYCFGGILQLYGCCWLASRIFIFMHCLKPVPL